MTTSQTSRILTTLQRGATLSTAQARSRGIQRLSARIFDLRSSGVPVQTTFVTRNGVRTARYSLGR